MYKYVSQNDIMQDIDFVDDAGMTLRTDAQYDTDWSDFYVMEARWQQTLRTQTGVTKWDSVAVSDNAGGADTYPHPGRKWQLNTGETRYLIYNTELQTADYVSKERETTLEYAAWARDNKAVGYESSTDDWNTGAIIDKVFKDEYYVAKTGM
jgi:hypothetical protein